MQPGMLGIGGAGDGVGAQAAVQRENIPKGRRLLTRMGALNQSLDWGLEPDFPIARVRAQTFTARYEGLQVRGSHSPATFSFLSPRGNKHFLGGWECGFTIRSADSVALGGWR